MYDRIKLLEVYVSPGATHNEYARAHLTDEQGNIWSGWLDSGGYEVLAVAVYHLQCLSYSQGGPRRWYTEHRLTRCGWTLEIEW